MRGGEYRVDEGVGRAKIVGRFEKTADVFGREDGPDIRVFAEDRTKVAIFRLGAAAGGFHEFVGGCTVEFFAEGDGDGFGVDEAVR